MIFKKILGKLIYGFGKAIAGILEFFILFFDFIVKIVVKIGKGLIGIIGLGGCLFLIMMAPLSIALLFHPVVLSIIAILIIVPILGTKLVSYLKYIKYIFSEYLFDYANNLASGNMGKTKSLNEYGKKYRRMEEDKRRRDQQKRQAEQQRMWEERFRQWYEYQQSQTGGSTYNQTFVNPSIEFKNKYEQSCDLLEVDYNSDIYQIKLAYRKKAKKYHPDSNKSPDATKLFQEINNAYEFLNAENIARYKTIV